MVVTMHTFWSLKVHIVFTDRCTRWHSTWLDFRMVFQPLIYILVNLFGAPVPLDIFTIVVSIPRASLIWVVWSWLLDPSYLLLKMLQTARTFIPIPQLGMHSSEPPSPLQNSRHQPTISPSLSY
ncbi:hypothetical protein BCR34DRAFT_24034 [Clohesyomyces aquaticus]|uniref:Uncharacterized protein n=1 Tax=Clohesyomyces aquaticus TaxID=1231657 RepID=A0A1Y2A588_9PLEO|nr:hypothetical protein BCR34DRAFT_24034 [Clohesyomyces aquaticus]